MPSLPPPGTLVHQTLSPVPSHAELHNGLSGDYEMMLALIRNTPPATLAGTLIRPTRCSPMALEDENGQRSLQALLQNEDYQAQCRALGVPHYHLTVTVTEGKARYETRSRNRETALPIVLNEPAAWGDWLSNTERTARLLGGQIRYNSEVTFAAMAWYYGIPLREPLNDDQRAAATCALQEKRARHTLGLADVMDIDALDLSSVNGAAPVNDPIIATVREALSPLHTSLLAYLSPFDINQLTTAELRAKPTFYLEQILLSDKAQHLARALMQALNWFGGQPGEESAPRAQTGLLVKAIERWSALGKETRAGAVAGYDWQAASNWGKSYEQIGQAFQSHLQASKRAASVNESILLACLYRPSFPLDFQVRDIPAQLPYRSSAVWVNFVHGVRLANATDPNKLQRLSFQNLVDLPGEYLNVGKPEERTPEDLKLVTLTRLEPVLDWAVTNGFVAQRADAHYSARDIEEATQKFDDTVDTLNSTIRWLDLPPPERLPIARLKMEKVFGKHYFAEGGRKLLKEGMSLTVPAMRNGGPIGRLAPDAHTFVDVYASGQLAGDKKWFITATDGKSPTDDWVRIDGDNVLQTNLDGSTFSPPLSAETPFPDITRTFETHFKLYLQFIKQAYRTLISYQLASLPLADRQALDRGVVRLYSLRKATSGIEAANETEKQKRPLRARKGFILQATWSNQVTYYELIPRAGVIRRRTDIRSEHLNGEKKREHWKISSGTSVSVTVLGPKTLPFDWDAHASGTAPAVPAECEAILDQVGDTIGATGETGPTAETVTSVIPRTLASTPVQALTGHVSQHLLFLDEEALHDSCRGVTEFDRRRADSEAVTQVMKMFVPFWNSIEDLNSGERERLASGAFGLFTDLVAFLFPAGKFASGSLRLINAGGRLSVINRLPSFALLTASFLNASLNPLDGIPSLLKAGSLSLFRLSKRGYLSLKTMSGRAGQYDFIQGMPQATDPGRWRPLSTADQLGTVRGVDDVPLRNVAAENAPDFRLVDPLSSRPYGPALSEDVLFLGRSSYTTLRRTDTHVLVELPGDTRVREVFGTDDSLTVYLDDIPYRLQNDTLSRVVDPAGFKISPCRVGRAPGEACRYSYSVLGTPAPRPAPETFDDNKGWATWFCDTIIYPAPDRQPPLFAYQGKIYVVKGNDSFEYCAPPGRIGLESNIPIPRPVVEAKIEFQTGIFLGLEVKGTVEHIDDIHKVGAIYVPSLTHDHQYIFTRLNDADYYMDTLLPGEPFPRPLKLKKLEGEQWPPGSLEEELIRVYLGSYTANYIAWQHGTDKIDAVLKNMEDFSTPIGTPSHPPANMKKIQVDTSPAEALMFDRRTRVSVSKLPDGAAVWEPVRNTTEEIRIATNDTIKILLSDWPAAGSRSPSTITIDNAMDKAPRSLRDRNIAFAKVITSSKEERVYVSVSGTRDNTRELPLFKSRYGATEVEIDGVHYFNIDSHLAPTEASSLSVGAGGKILSIPRLKDQSAGASAVTQPTSADTESKLIRYISDKFPNADDIESITIATTLPPCDSCSVVMKRFASERGMADALNVIWGKRARRRH